MNNPKVSVCMIVYNHAEYIKEAIQSVMMQQTNFDVELIISNDASTDNTHETILKLLDETDRIKIRYFNQKDNKGMMPNFTFTLKESKGDYIALCEGDDYWTDPLKLQKQIDFLENNKDYALCFHPCTFLKTINNSKKFSEQKLSVIKYKYTVQNLLQYWNIPTASMVFKRSPIINNFPSWFNNVASGDIALVMLLFENGKFKLLEDVMSVYRVNNGASISHKKYRMIHYRAILYTHLNEFFNFKYEEEIFDALNYIYVKFSEEDKIVDNNKNKWDKILNKLLNHLK